ncbi:glycerophosphodiester phosphodiesterase domain-containing protein 5-like isoform X1 [Branchiostoma floridae x Branchiostoma belcheri]
MYHRLQVTISASRSRGGGQGEGEDTTMVSGGPLRHQTFCFTCVLGLYGCRWRQQVDPNEKRWVERIWFVVMLLAVGFASFWMYFWLVVWNDADDFNWWIYQQTGKWVNWYWVILAATSTAFGYAVFLLLLAAIHVCFEIPVYLHWLHKILVVLLLCGCTASVVLMQQLWLDGFKLAWLSLQMTGPWLHLGAVGLMTVSSWVIAGQWAQVRTLALQIFWFVFYLGVMGGLYVAPLFITSPCFITVDQLPKKPNIGGHRGAPMLAPENTLLSFQTAIDNNATMIETDVQISIDGVPFLMHDGDLRRTTNIADVFPNRVNDNAATFNISELKRLNAGKWFLQSDPFGTVGGMSARRRALIANQSVGTFKDFLQLANTYNIRVIFDLYPPPRGHPFHKNFANYTLNFVLQSGLPQSSVVWLQDSDRFTIRKRAPFLKQGTGNKISPVNMKKLSLTVENLDYRQYSQGDYSLYSKNNITTVTYIVHSSWLFSYLWCSGADTVTSNGVNLVRNLNSPSWRMNPFHYRVLWITTDVLSGVCILVCFLVQRRRKAFGRNHVETVRLEMIEEAALPSHDHDPRKRLLSDNPADDMDDDDGTLEGATLGGTLAFDMDLPVVQHEEVAVEL